MERFSRVARDYALATRREPTVPVSRVEENVVKRCFVVSARTDACFTARILRTEDKEGCEAKSGKSLKIAGEKSKK